MRRMAAPDACKGPSQRHVPYLPFTTQNQRIAPEPRQLATRPTPSPRAKGIVWKSHRPTDITT